ncbi:MAG: DUF1294 domain-containing protein [Lachnospiraceae bacterium]|nr:DUF1294 domain-containing protein [Lachnospiraceae bacterium]
MQKVFIIYLAAINFITFAAFGTDKWKAASHRWRISEATLLGLCFTGGSVGGLLGMYLFRHKTRKPAFFAGIPLMIIIQIAVFFLIRNGSLL